MSRTTLVLGGGQLAFDLQRVWQRNHPDDALVGLGHAQVDVADLGSVRVALAEHRPELVVNTAAYNRVDEAEGALDRAFAVNATGAGNVALACREVDAVLVHVSTDYVFSGSSRRPYVEGDPVVPVNVYGASKAAGEMLVRCLLPRHFIVRSSGLYGVAGSSGKGGNFVETMLGLARSGRDVRVVDDQVLTPTPTAALADQIAVLATTDAYDTYHATCQGECTWHDFAAEIFRRAGLHPPLERQSSAQLGAKARRPAYSVLENANLRRLGLDVLPDWRDGLADYLALRGAAFLPGG
jgi:dTDP-4-dehydrorhamnose reductase